MAGCLLSAVVKLCKLNTTTVIASPGRHHKTFRARHKCASLEGGCAYLCGEKIRRILLAKIVASDDVQVRLKFYYRDCTEHYNLHPVNNHKEHRRTGLTLLE